MKKYFIIVPPTSLSGEDIWINVLTQKRYTVHIDGFDVRNDLRSFLNFLAHPFSSKLRAKEAKGLKSGNFGKQKKNSQDQLFIRFNFVFM